MTAPLPPNWTEEEDDEGYPFFYCKELNISQYEHPLDNYYREYIKNQKKNN